MFLEDGPNTGRTELLHLRTRRSGGCHPVGCTHSRAARRQKSVSPIAASQESLRGIALHLELTLEEIEGMEDQHFHDCPDYGRRLHAHFVVVFPENVSHCEQLFQVTWSIG